MEHFALLCGFYFYLFYYSFREQNISLCYKNNPENIVHRNSYLALYNALLNIL